jgi:hypothetical protein
MRGSRTEFLCFYKETYNSKEILENIFKQPK